MSSTRCSPGRFGRCAHPCGIDSGAFLAEQRNGDFLKPSETDTLLARAATGDKAARDEIICRLVPLAFSLARQECKGRWRLVDDLAAEAMVVLVETVAGWDYSKPAGYLVFEFTQQARASMRAVFLNGTNPLSVTRRYARVPATRWEDEIRKKRMSPAVLDYLAIVPESPLELGSVPVEPKEIAEADTRMDIEAMLSRLPERKREVIERHFGIGGREPEQFKDIAASFKFSKQRAFEHFRSGMDRLRGAAASQAV